jgi:hypothetical protein
MNSALFKKKHSQGPNRGKEGRRQEKKKKKKKKKKKRKKEGEDGRRLLTYYYQSKLKSHRMGYYALGIGNLFTVITAILG